jgi:hypothetical protein
MKYLITVLGAFLLVLFSCTKVPVDLNLDELQDKENYTRGMVVNCETYMGQQVERALVNGSETDKPDILDLSTAGYYRIEAYLKNMDQSAPVVIRVVILDPERGEADWGLPPWTPVVPETGEIGEQEVRLVYPASAPSGMTVPLIVIVGEELTLSDSYLDATFGETRFRIKNGVGSAQILAGSGETALKIDHRNILVNINTMDTPPVSLSGTLDADKHIPAGSYIQIPGDLTIPEGLTLSIGSGSFISIDPGVNIINNGLLFFAGSAGAPVTVTCSDSEAFWGGFIGTSSGNRVEATFTLFNRSGFHTGGEYSYGHAGRQALFYCRNGELQLDHCYMTDHIGQVFYPVSCDLNLSDCLVQRAKTGGQVNQSELAMDRCVFTDFPDDSYIYRDEDNDGLYLNETNATINNSIFMFAKDDGLDTGASGGGDVIITNSRFESNFHEGAALSSGGNVTKLHRITNCLFTNCGQGLELGYSSANHHVEAESCRFIKNGIGIRYGDCYEMPHHGFIHVANSESLENSWYDVWNMNREHWDADTSHMSFENVMVSTPSSLYPDLITYDN